MRIYVNEQEQPLLLDVLGAELAKVKADGAAMQNEGNWMAAQWLLHRQRMIEGLLEKLGEKVAA